MRRLLSFFTMTVLVVTLSWADTTVFYESFDQTAGKGGNDGSWSGQIANSTVTYDNDGWEVTNPGGGDKCLKTGKSSVRGKAITPAITVTAGSTYTLTFKAGAWDASSEKTDFSVTATGGTLSGTIPSSLNKGQFDDYSVTFTATGSSAQFTFENPASSGNGRFFLDEVKLVEGSGGDTPIPVTVAVPTFSPVAGEVESGTQVTISQPDAAMIIYTLDGSTPSYANNEGTIYESPITITEALTIKAIAVDDDGNESEVATAAYTIKQSGGDEPVVVTTGTKFRRINSVSELTVGSTYLIVCEDNSSAWYNTRTQGTDGITIANGVAKLDEENANYKKFKQFALGGTEGAYTFCDGENYVQWNTSTTLSLTAMPEDAAKAQWKISFNGNVAFIENVSSSRKIFAFKQDDFRAYAAATNDSYDIQLYVLDENAEEPTVTVANPVFNPDGGTFNDAVSVTITSETEGAEIYYTMTDDYSFPAVPTEASTKYEGPIELSASGYYWLHAIAIKDGVKSSPVQNYYLLEIEDKPVSQAEAPVITPNGGNFSGEQLVSISANGEVDMILYTTDGQDPSFELGIGTDYDDTGAFTITKSTVVKAIALDPDAVPTEVVTAEFKLNPATAPVFTPEDGTEFEESLNVKLSSDNAAVIVYTLDGSTPSMDNEAALLYEEAGIDITETTTIKAVAYNNDDVATDVVTATFTKKGSDEPVVSTFARINQLSNLKVGETYLIVNEANKTSVVNSATQTTEITLNEGVATLEETADVNQYVLGGEAGAYTLVCNEKYLQYSGSGTTLSWRALPEDVTLAQWDITFDGNNVVLKNVQSGRVLYAYNSGNNNEFRLYTNPNSSCTPVQFYMKGLDTPDPTVEPTVVGAPTIDPESKEFSEAFDATITAGENGISLVYVVNDGDEVAVAETTAIVAIPAETTKLTAYSVAEDGTRSDATTVTYTFNAPVTLVGAPTIDPESKEFSEAFDATITAGENGVSLVYVVNDGDEVAVAETTAIVSIPAETTKLTAYSVAEDGTRSEAATATYTFKSDEPVEGDYARINKAADLEVGATYIIVCEDKSTAHSLTDTQSSDIEIADGVASLTEGSKVNEFVLGGEEDAYTLSVGEKVLQWSTGTSLKFNTVAEGDEAKAEWKITFDGNNALMVNVSSERQIYAYQDSKFRAYTNPGSNEVYAIQLYKKGGEAPVEPTKVGAPTIDPESKEFSEAFDATITAGENGVSLVYVVNDGDEVAVAETTAIVSIPAETTKLTAYSVAEDGTRSEAATATYTFKSDEPVEGDYARINKAADLEVGATYIIVCEDKATAHSLTDTQSSDIEIADGVASLTEGSKVNEFVLGGEEDAYTLSVGEKVLQWSSGTSLKFNTVAEGDEAKAEWKITFDGNNALMINVSSERQIYAYQDSKFRAYTNPGSNEVYAIQLYKKGGEDPVEPTKGDVNEDGSVNVGDVAELYKIILGIDKTYERNGDINGDGSINAGDVGALYKIITGSN